MSDTRQLITRIAAFRERLEQTAQLAAGDGEPAGAVATRVAADPAAVATALKLLAPPTVTVTPGGVTLTMRARELLVSARSLVARERELGADDCLQSLLGCGPEPLADYYRETVALTESGLKLAQSLPESPEAQLRMCEGLATLFAAAEDRVATVARALATRRRDAERIDGLARRLSDLSVGRVVDFDYFVKLGEELLHEAGAALPVAFLSADVHSTCAWSGRDETAAPARFVAAHALTVAQVVARAVPHDYEWASNPLTPVLAALLMDVGMLSVPLEVLAKPGPLDAAERRLLAAHPARSAAIVAAVYPDSDLVCEAIQAHHERPDGTGYPAGASDDAVPTLARLLAACDYYAAQCGERPQRPAIDPRTALTETLFAAEAGRVDRDFAELLVHLAMYPVGSVVELTDGRVAAVVANHPARVNLRAAARPVVAVLTDSDGLSYPKPEHLDLAASDRGGVVRALTPAERRAKLARHYPEFCA